MEDVGVRRGDNEGSRLNTGDDEAKDVPREGVFCHEIKQTP